MNTRIPRWVVLPFFGVTPPTIWVPYSIACGQGQRQGWGRRERGALGERS